MSRREVGSLILSAIPVLITLAVESVSSWIKGKQQRRVDEAVTAIRMETEAERNKLRQHSHDFMMYGKYHVESLQNVIDTVNDIHETDRSGKTGFRLSLWRNKIIGRKHEVWL